jgi:hypothetical protein
MVPNVNSINNRIEGRTFVGADIQVDGGVLYSNCTFVSCNLVVTGARPALIDGCKLENPRWSFAGPAANVLSFLKANFKTGDRGMVEGILREIRGAPPVSRPAPKSGGVVQ